MGSESTSRRATTRSPHVVRPMPYVVSSERARMLVTFTPGGLEAAFFVELGVPVVGGEPPAEEVLPPVDELARRF